MMFDNPDIPFDDIGRMTVEFSGLDFLVHVLAMRLLGIDETRGFVQTSGMQTRALADFVKNLVDTNDPPYSIEFQANVRDVVEQIKRVAERRDIITHGVWRSHDGRFGVVRLRDVLRKWDKIERVQHVAPGDVQPITTECQKLSGHVLELLDRWHSESVR